MTPEQLAGWAAQEIRELDELARSMIPGYEPLDSREMDYVRELEDFANGEMVDDTTYLEEIAELESEVARLEDALQHISSLADFS